MRWLKSWGLPIALILGFQIMSGHGLLSGGALLPPLEGEWADGRPFAGIPPGEGPSLIYFWGSWCGICRSMEGTIERVSKDHRVLTVALSSGDAATVAGYLESRGLHYDALADTSGRLGDRFGVRGVPALFFVDGKGRVQFATTGYTSEPGIRLRLFLLDRNQ